MRYNAERIAKQSGFTLIELLIVIAIIVVIAAILFPVFGAVRERGRRTVCQSNLKQIALAMQQYVQDSGGAYPISVRYEGQDCLAQWPKAIFPYVKDVQVFQCPDHPRGEADPVESSVDQLPAEDMDYQYNVARLNAILTAPPSVSNAQGNHEAILLTPSTTWLNMETYWTDGDGVNHFFREVTSSCGRRFSGNILHSGGGNYSYVDSHVKWLTPEEAGEVECLNGPLPHPFND